MIAQLLLWSTLAWGQLVEPPLIDDCNRTEDPLAGSAAQCASPPCWSRGIHTAQNDEALLANGTVCVHGGSPTGWASAWWNAQTFPADQVITATMPDGTVPASPAFAQFLYVRVTNPGVAGTTDGYRCTFNLSSGQVNLDRVDNGVVGSIVSSAAVSPVYADGNSLGCRMVGSTLSAWIKRGATWSQLLAATDATYSSSGFVGLSTNPNNTANFDNIRAGAVSAEPVSQGAIMPLLQ